MPSRPGPARPHAHLCTIVTFRDALGLAFELAATRGPGCYGLLSDAWHRPVGLLVHPPGPVGAGPARWLPPGPPPGDGWHPPATRGGGLLVLSVGLDPPAPPGPGLRQAYLAHRGALARQGITLRDWIRTDGDLFASMAHTLHPASAWPDDPPEHRPIDRRWASGRSPSPPSAHGPAFTTQRGVKPRFNRNQQRPGGP